MKVVKFGGTSLASAEQIEKIGAVIKSDQDRRIVVVSAPGKRHPDDVKVTDLLINTARNYLDGQDCGHSISKVIDRYNDIAEDLGIDKAFIKYIQNDIKNLINTDIDNEDAFMDSMKAAGEDNCAKLVSEYLRSLGVEANYVNPKVGGMILSNEPGNARMLEESYEKLRTLRDKPGVTVFPGFFGYSETGKVVTFPRGGSDITGAILAAAVNADIYENFTDVDSVFVANPLIVNQPVSVEEITYREMRELSYAGFSVFHDEALEPVFHADIPVVIKNTNNPSSPGTRIVPNRKTGRHPIVGIAANDGFCSIYVSKYLMNREIGFGRRILQIFEEENISFEHTPSGIDNISIIVSEDSFDIEVEKRVEQRLRNELKADEVTIERGLALVMIVGEGMRKSKGVAAKACTAFSRAGINLEMINQGSSEVSMMFGIKATEAPNAVRALHSEFFPATN
jgi:aspartate kinase